MRIAIIGARGQLGSELVRLLGDDAIPIGRDQADLAFPDTLRPVLQETQPDAVINCAAFTQVDRAEEAPEIAYTINAFAVREMARWCQTRNRLLVQISTDHVFGRDTSRQTPYTESDTPGPINTYGQSKLLGEQEASSLCSRHLIVRTCGLYGRYGQGGKGTNFVETMLRLGTSGKAIRVVDDQLCAPTPAGCLASSLISLINSGARGLVHLTSQGDCTWYEFARTIFNLAGMSVDLLPITTSEFGARAPRPTYSVLTSEKGAGPLLPWWQDGLAAYLKARSA